MVVVVVVVVVVVAAAAVSSCRSRSGRRRTRLAQPIYKAVSLGKPTISAMEDLDLGIKPWGLGFMLGCFPGFNVGFTATRVGKIPPQPGA